MRKYLQIFESKRKLRIGYFTSLSFFPLMGDTEETVRRAKSTLESLGHTLVPYEIPNDEHIAKIMADIANADTGSYLRKALQGEKISDAARMVNQLINMPFWLRKLLAMIVKWKYLPWFRSARAVYCLLAGLDLQLTTQLWDVMGEKQRIIQEILRRMDAEELDLILCPVFPFPALRVDDSKDLVGKVLPKVC
jgi:Asp-tRNA(Asn)/Glu-tRNA(Gln) amidotransferase A subunit family amidase